MPEDDRLVSAEAASPGDAEAIRCLREGISSGRHWYLALLEAMGHWTSSQEVYRERRFVYLVGGEAFDWLLLAERLCETIDGLIPENEKVALLLHGQPPLELSSDELRGLIGECKYQQYLNYFYGVTAEESLVLAVQDEIEKERRLSGFNNWAIDITEEVFRRIYGATREELLKTFRKEHGYIQKRSTSLGELKEFTYWLFKYRFKHSEKARIASDTRKALEYLKAYWRQRDTAGIGGIASPPAGTGAAGQTT